MSGIARVSGFNDRFAVDRQQAGLLRPSARSKISHPAARLCPEGVGAWLAGDLPRSGSKTSARGAPEATKPYGFATASRWIVSKLDSYGLRPEAKPHTPQSRFYPQGVGAWLASDLPRSGSKTGAHGAPNATKSYGFATATPWIVSKLHSYGLRPEAKAQTRLRQNQTPHAHRNPPLPAGRRSLACQRSAAKRQ